MKKSIDKRKLLKISVLFSTVNQKSHSFLNDFYF